MHEQLDNVRGSTRKAPSRLLRAAYRETRVIVKDSAPCEQAAHITMQLTRGGNKSA